MNTPRFAIRVDGVTTLLDGDSVVRTPLGKPIKHASKELIASLAEELNEGRGDPARWTRFALLCRSFDQTPSDIATGLGALHAELADLGERKKTKTLRHVERVLGPDWQAISPQKAALMSSVLVMSALASELGLSALAPVLAASQRVSTDEVASAFLELSRTALTKSQAADAALVAADVLRRGNPSDRDLRRWAEPQVSAATGPRDAAPAAKAPPRTRPNRQLGSGAPPVPLDEMPADARSALLSIIQNAKRRGRDWSIGASYRREFLRVELMGSDGASRRMWWHPVKARWYSADKAR